MHFIQFKMMSLTGQVILDLHFGRYHWQNINFYVELQYNEIQWKAEKAQIT